jgi:NAD+ synthase
MKTKQVIDHIVDWLDSYCGRAGMNGFVVGVSGGIDSAVTSTLCARTGRKVVAVTMPIHQSPDQETLATRHIAWLEQAFDTVQGERVDLTPLFQSVAETLPAGIQDGLSMANTRSRLRMLTLYAFAGHHTMLVAGTGNKVEDFGVGFYTKYGDGGVDVSPIADLLKSEVYAVATELGISRAIQQAPPTDGLWQDGRSDEAQIGATYDELEWAMSFMEDGRAETDLTERQQKVLTIYKGFNEANRHKMVAIPVCSIPPRLKG